MTKSTFFELFFLQNNQVILKQLNHIKMGTSRINNTSGTNNTGTGQNAGITMNDGDAIMRRANELAQSLSGEASLTSVLGAANLMASSGSHVDWNIHCEAVKIANGGDFPRFWYPQIVQSGLYADTVKKFDKPS
jgi:hypothetical protein